MSDAPSLAEALGGLTNGRALKGPACTVGIILTKLAEEDPDGHEALVDAVDNRAISASPIADILSKRGHPVSAQTVRRHRMRQASSGCACPR